jgi:hypothetical protein
MSKLDELQDLAKGNKDFNAVTAVKTMSREAFKDMPKPKRIPDKRFKKPKHKNKLEE